MKYVLVIGDGMADYPVPELGNLTPLQVAYKPNIDRIAAEGRCGLIKTVPDSLMPGSDVAILSVLGYDPEKFCTGRGPLEAAARGIKLRKNDVAFRCNLITEAEGILVDYAAGHITTSEAEQLINAIKEAYEKPGKIEFYSGLDFRHFMILRNFPLASSIEFFPPHDVVGSKISEVLPKATSDKVKKMAELIDEIILSSKKVLDSHPVNVARKRQGKHPGNMIWPWGGGKKPSMPSFKEKYGLDAAVISAVDLVKGIGFYANMQVINVPGATGLADTNYEGKAEAALKALQSSDFVFVHVEAPDEAGHVRDYKLKVKTIEDLDKRLISKILEDITEPYSIAILPDHPTPIVTGTHVRDPVPFAIHSSVAKGSDNLKKFDEYSARQGSYGLVTKESLISLLLKSTS